MFNQGGRYEYSFLFSDFISVFRFSILKSLEGTSLVAQWLRVRLPMQGTWIWVLVPEDPTCRGATEPVRHDCWAYAPQLLRPVWLEPMLCNGRGHHNGRPVHCAKSGPHSPQLEKACATTRTKCSQKKIIII